MVISRNLKEITLKIQEKYVQSHCILYHFLPFNTQVITFKIGFICAILKTCQKFVPENVLCLFGLNQYC
jgi:hypothetical protein